MQLAGLNDFTDFCSAQAFFINECLCHRISRIAPEADGSHGLAFRGLKLGLQFIIPARSCLPTGQADLADRA